MTIYNKSDYTYTPLFCEENIWLLAQALIGKGQNPGTIEILFFSNRDRRIALFNQSIADSSQPVVWDYHVVLRIIDSHQDFIFDFDTRLDFPATSSMYFCKTFAPGESIPVELKTRVRVIPASSYLKYFFSDRQHMKDVIPDSEFPEYPVITPADGNRRIDLSEYWNMEKELDDGSYFLDPDLFIK